ncbi:HipA family kinase [Acidobacterium sp. S8]|uniref:HipA family kinase n=1 Tax=Acidobacterium sp. S8 TaxID=1641854 RepID=UPI00131DD582|nr:HipA family kinase [Acidobacterium sp. S8]
MLRTVRATRYVTPLREGGSLPAIIEADDLGMYVLKFRGAGQGPLALLAELVAGEMGRALGLRVPELVFVEVEAALGRNEPDAEIRDLLKRSVGLNLALDYLPGSTMFDPAAGDTADAKLASLAVWFDAFVANVDRTPRNPNLLKWHGDLYFIDHGAALYFHHNWQSIDTAAHSQFSAIRNHVMLPWASALDAADAEAHQQLNTAVFAQILDAVPDAWVTPEGGVADATERRAAYVRYFDERLAASSSFVEEAKRVRAELV